MANEVKLKEIFSEALSIPINHVVDSLEYNTIPKWDSLDHMAIIAKIETYFDIMLDTDDIIDMSNFKKAKEILNKYDIKF